MNHRLKIPLMSIFWATSLWGQAITLASRASKHFLNQRSQSTTDGVRRFIGSSSRCGLLEVKDLIHSTKKLPLDVSTFRTLVQENYLCVDKTENLYKNILKDRYFFLARPRHFGKSLLISTLEEMYAGNSTLFKDCWIGTSDYAWPRHPVVSLNFSKLDSTSPERLERSLEIVLDTIAQKHSINLSRYLSPGLKLDALISQLSKQNSVVVLIDEYDYPLLNNVNNLTVAEGIRNVLKNFFFFFLSLDAHLRAIFVTGVSKFSKTSIFSGLNNLNDLTIDPVAATMCGYTESEIDRYFAPYLKELASAEGKSVEDIRPLLRTWYNGYRFSEEPVKVYNPYSILYTLKKKKFNNYWFETGTPSFLVSKLAQETDRLEDIEDAALTSNSLGTFDIGTMPLITLLFQKGYLTIQDYNRTSDTYKLGYPNTEVRESFTLHLFAAFAKTDIPTIERVTPRIKHALNNGHIDQFCNYLQVLFAHIPYQLHIAQEKYYHSLFQLLGLLIGYPTDSEISTDKGRIDVVLSSENHIYIIEIKLGSDPAIELKQIEQRTYYEKYLLQGKKIILVGLAFNPIHEKLSITYASKELPHTKGSKEEK